jgi:hypothetical protein
VVNCALQGRLVSPLEHGALENSWR